ncbi:MAG TPA: hypothetical protein VFB60_06105 [Ktedonobacteraceae bacterium]|nr:hypothetical protein [Ktedonobacteraceae bacterium]
MLRSSAKKARFAQIFGAEVAHCAHIVCKEDLPTPLSALHRARIALIRLALCLVARVGSGHLDIEMS